METAAGQIGRPVWAEVSATALTRNLRAMQAAAGDGTTMLAVVKADAYGHGAAACAPVLAGAGAAWLGVTSAAEGALVRRSLAILPQGMHPRVLVMCGLWPGEEALCLDAGLTPVVWEPYHLQLLEMEAQRRGDGAGSIAVHVEIDTGMARQGVAPGAPLEALLQQLRSSPALQLEGVLTHMASAECAADAQNAQQWSRFREALQQVRASGLRPALVHVGNTSGIDSGDVAAHLRELAREFDATAMTRTGLGVYGHALPLNGAEPRAAGLLSPVLTWKTRVVSLREVEAGATVGYNATWTAPHRTRLALLPVGYADGYRRALSGEGSAAGGAVWICGARCPVVGRVSMDLTTVDVSAVPEVRIGDEVELLGPRIPAEEHAKLAGTSVYEVLCGISDRVPRVLVEE